LYIWKSGSREALGLEEGLSEGELEGDEEGELLGDDEGEFEGEPEGELLGEAEGELEGELEGEDAVAGLITKRECAQLSSEDQLCDMVTEPAVSFGSVETTNCPKLASEWSVLLLSVCPEPTVTVLVDCRFKPSITIAPSVVVVTFVLGAVEYPCAELVASTKSVWSTL
jgi:hypothetical protein